MINLDYRLKKVAQFVDKCDIFADIGSDHAYIPIYLLQNQIIKKAIITDINIGPLNNSRNNTGKYGFSDDCIFLLGDGLERITSYDIDCITISGMGGETIISILNRNIDYIKNIKQLILQPMSDYDKVLRFLNENGFKTDSLGIVKDDYLFYYIIKVHHEPSETEEVISKYDFLFPSILIDNKDLVMKQFLEYKLNQQNYIINKKQLSGKKDISKDNIELRNEIIMRLKEYET